MHLLKKDHSLIGETIYSGTFSNGRRLLIVPKKDFKEKCAVLVVNFGSLDTSLTDKKDAFSGIAHFLEHKLFEMENQIDAATLFTNLGADSNAFTTFDRTCYYFSSLDNFEEGVNLLTNFVNIPYFTKDSVEREQAIIGQEIDMYQDDPDYRLYQGVLENLYPNTLLAVDIAGTKESIQAISKSDLLENHDFYYQPQNQTLILVGDFEVQKLSDIFQDEEDLDSQQVEKIVKPIIVYEPVLSHRTERMEITIPKIAIGYRGHKLPQETSVLRQKLQLELFFAMILGWTSSIYQEWYDQRKIDDSFEIDIEVAAEYQFLILTMDTLEPIALSNTVRQYLKKGVFSVDLTDEHFQMVKKEMYGDYLRNLDSIENVALQLATTLSDKETYFDVPDMLLSLDLEEVKQVGQDFLATADVTDLTILPK